MLDLNKIAEILKDSDDKFIVEVNGQLLVLMNHQAYLQSKCAKCEKKDQVKDVPVESINHIITTEAPAAPLKHNIDNPLSIRDIIAHKSSFSGEYDRPSRTTEIDQRENSYFFQEVDD